VNSSVIASQHNNKIGLLAFKVFPPVRDQVDRSSTFGVEMAQTQDAAAPRPVEAAWPYAPGILPTHRLGLTAGAPAPGLFGAFDHLDGEATLTDPHALSLQKKRRLKRGPWGIQATPQHEDT
jgi:hypothetical protein